MAYHHGDLRPALLAAASRLLERGGLANLTLRGIAREAGVSHAAPRNHFPSLGALLSALAAEGFDSLRIAMEDAGNAAAPDRRLAAVASTYVRFAIDHPALYRLMFRSERIDMAHPALTDAARALADFLASVTAGADSEAKLDEAQAVRMALAWAEVHGLASLAIDGLLAPIAARLASGGGEEALLDRIFSAA
jgi:AcrR family transcriptional regulator